MIVPFPGSTVGEVPIGDVLDGAPRDLDRVLVIGRQPNGELYLAASDGNLERAVYDLAEAQHRIYDGSFESDYRDVPAA